MQRYTSPIDTTVPSSHFAASRDQTANKRKKARFQKHMRKPASFDTYLLRRSNSTSSTSSLESLQIPEDQITPYTQITASPTTITQPQQLPTIITTAPPSSAATSNSNTIGSGLVRRVSSVMRFMDMNFNDWDTRSVTSTYSTSTNCSAEDCEWEEEDEDEEEFYFMSSAKHRRNGSVCSNML